MGERTADGKPDNDIYTVLVILATVLVVSASIYMVIRGQELFGSWNPFAGA